MRFAGVGLAGFILTSTVLASSAPIRERQRLVASDGATNDWFGQSVSVDGNTLVVGAFIGNGTRGSAYVFGANGSRWTQQQKLVASDGVPESGFGQSVAISGDVLAVSSFYDTLVSISERGQVYLFGRTGSGWTEQQKLAPAVTTGVRFGDSLALDGDTLLIGGPIPPAEAYTQAGLAYVFVRIAGAWVEEQQLLPSDPQAMSGFGRPVAVEGSIALVAAPAYGANDTGVVYVFVRNGSTWTEEARLAPPDPATNGFGLSIALSGETAIIAGRSGPAYVYVRAGGTWNEQARLIPANGGAAEPVALIDETALAGGTVFGREGTAWSELSFLDVPDELDWRDASASLSRDGIAVVGSPNENDDRGAAHVFFLYGGDPESDSEENTSGAGCGCAIPREAGNDLARACVAVLGLLAALVFRRRGRHKTR